MATDMHPTKPTTFRIPAEFPSGSVQFGQKAFANKIGVLESLKDHGVSAKTFLDLLSRPYSRQLQKVFPVDALNVLDQRGIRQLGIAKEFLSKPFVNITSKDKQSSAPPTANGSDIGELEGAGRSEPPAPPIRPLRKDKLEPNPPMLGGKRLTLRFDRRGNVRHEDVSRHDALKMVQDAAATAMTLSPKTNDSFQPSRADKGFVEIPNIHMRDVRKLDNAFAIVNNPSITVRCQGILVNADPIRAVITRDSCVVFLQDGAEVLIPELESKFKDHMEESAVYGFEFTALEAILATICTALAKDCAQALPIAQAVVDNISQNPTVEELERLQATKNTMDQLKSRVTGMRKAFVDILENEEDLRMMHLTKLYKNPLLTADLFRFDSEQLESLLEVYLEEIYDTQTQISLMLDNLQNTRTIAMLKLGAKRNYLLTVNLTLTLWTTLITVPTFVVGTFGMNLKSNVEELDCLFYIVAGACVVFPVGAYRYLLRHFRKRGISLGWKDKY
ncbi:hypothetical protein LEN26_014829 [Aphanomyces euteiches]|nr:hypothetical protein LEN26_014829 [Aphanomyces euteiches]KAH9182086.1 hypothetical protein AeNC1_015936 [Aphanomyces euteiches]